MKKSQSTATVFFPSSHKFSSGFLIGFNYRGFLACVVDVIPFTSVRPTQRLAQQHRISPQKNAGAILRPSAFPGSTGNLPVANSPRPTSRRPRRRQSSPRRHPGVQVRVRHLARSGEHRNLPAAVRRGKCRELTCCGYRYDVEGSVIMYDTRKQCYLSAEEYDTLRADLDEEECDLNFILRIINIRNELSQSLHAALSEVQGSPVKDIKPKMPGLFTKLMWILALIILGIYYVPCLIGYFILYVFQVIPIPFYTYMNHLACTFSRRLKDVSCCLHSLKELLATCQQLSSGHLIQTHSSRYRLHLLLKEVKFYSKLFKVFFVEM